MENNLKQKFAKIVSVVKETVSVSTLILGLPEQDNFAFRAGQFVMIGIPGFGECPLGISSNPADAQKQISVTVRQAGELTEKLNQLKKGDCVTFRGPFGNGFPEVASNLILIAGGCGIAPLMAVILENQKRKDIKIQIFIGCKDAATLIYKEKYKQLQKTCDLSVALEQKSLLKFGFISGSVINAIAKKKLVADAKVFICGPEAMYSSVAKILLEKGIAPKDIYMSLEKRMHCGVGVCEHCAIGTKYICKDGPVFDYEFLKNIDKYKI